MKTVVDLKSCFLAVMVTNTGTGSPRDTTVFLPVQSLKNQKPSAVGAPVENLPDLCVQHTHDQVSGATKESVCLHASIGSSKPEIRATLVVVQDRLDVTKSEDEKTGEHSSQRWRPRRKLS